jgi:hypothetical protein
MQSTTWYKPARSRYAHVTEDLAKALEGVSKAANDLGHYLFRVCIDGKLEEIELYDLPLGEQRSTEKMQGRRYSRETLRNALHQLVDRGLVIIDRMFRGGTIRLTIRHLGERIPILPLSKKFGNPSKSLTFDNKIRQTHPSIPHSTVTNTENIKEHSDTSPPLERLSAVPTSVKGTPIGAPPLTEPPGTANSDSLGGGEENISPCSVDPLISNDIAVTPPPPDAPSPTPLDQLDAPPDHLDDDDDPRFVQVAKVMILNPQLRTEILKFSLEQITQAIAVFLERRPTVDNPEGFLIKALRQGWRPKQTKIAATSSDFDEWYKLANECDVAKASTAIKSKLHVFTDDGWQPWESVSAAFPIPLLREMLEKRAATRKR